MLKSIFSRVSGRKKAVVLVVVALTVLTAGTAAAITYTTSTRPALKLNKASYVGTALTKLASNAIGPALTLETDSTDPSATPLSLHTEEPSSQAPMQVNSDTKVDNLNADTVDGKSSEEFLGGGDTVHRFGPTRLVEGEGAPVVSVGPFEIWGLCHGSPNQNVTQSVLFVDQASLPASYISHYPESSGYSTFRQVRSNSNWQDDYGIAGFRSGFLLAGMFGDPLISSAIGSAHSHGGEDKQIHFNIYMERSHPATSLFDECTFGGYVVEG